MRPAILLTLCVAIGGCADAIRDDEVRTGTLAVGMVVVEPPRGAPDVICEVAGGPGRLAAGTTLRVLCDPGDTDPDRPIVAQILDGPHRGQSAWIARRHLRVTTATPYK